MIDRYSILAKIIMFFKQIKSDFMEGYYDGQTRVMMKQYRRKKK